MAMAPTDTYICTKYEDRKPCKKGDLSVSANLKHPFEGYIPPPINFFLFTTH